MSNNEITIQERSKRFAIRAIKAYCELQKLNYDDASRVLSKQFLRSSTSIGANCSEATYAQSTKDLINKYSIALKESNETLFWIEIMVDSGIVGDTKFASMKDETIRIIKILTSIINKLKAKENP
jgi:four helix bundle protein